MDGEATQGGLAIAAMIVLSIIKLISEFGVTVMGFWVPLAGLGPGRDLAG